MADNTRLPIGTADGDTYASDDITGVKFQRVKLVLGADGVNGGDVASGNPVPVSGTFWQTTQPVSGTVTANAGTGPFPVTGTFWQATQPVSGTVTANAGTGTLAVQDTASLVDNAGFTDGTSRILPNGFIYDEVAGTALTENDVAAARLNVNRAQVGVIEDGATRARYATVSAANALKVDNSAVTQPVSGTFWQTTQPVSVAATLATKEIRSATATTSQVADTATTTTLLASNANRLGGVIQNDSSATLFVKLGTTASTTDYTVQLIQYAYYEVPFSYTGRIDGIWATDPNTGSARITELT